MEEHTPPWGTILSDGPTVSEPVRSTSKHPETTSPYAKKAYCAAGIGASTALPLRACRQCLGSVAKSHTGPPPPRGPRPARAAALHQSRRECATLDRSLRCEGHQRKRDRGPTRRPHKGSAERTARRACREPSTRVALRPTERANLPAGRAIEGRGTRGLWKAPPLRLHEASRHGNSKDATPQSG